MSGVVRVFGQGVVRVLVKGLESLVFFQGVVIIMRAFKAGNVRGFVRGLSGVCQGVVRVLSGVLSRSCPGVVRELSRVW